MDPLTIINLRMHLRQQNIVEFEQRVYDLSTPGHPSYGAHMSQKVIDNLLRPAEETLQLVMDWLSFARLNNIPSLDNNFLYINTTVAEASLLLNAEYAFFLNEVTGKVVLRTLSYSLPLDLHEHIDMIHPTTSFPSVSTRKATMLDGKQTTPAGRRRQAKGDMGHEFEKRKVRDDDLAIFEEIYANETVGTGYEFISVNGGLNTQYWGQDTVESAIDVQSGIALNSPTPVSYYQTAGQPPFNASLQITSDDSELYLEWLTFMLALNDTELAQVVSMSYADEEQSVSIAYAKTVCNLFAQLAARGSQHCLRLVMMGQVGSASPMTERTPLSATQHIEPEIGVSFSGGGFSNYFSRPSYQERAVSSYLENHGRRWAPYFNSTGRGYPDVSAQGTKVSIIYWGGHRYEAGTSCSTPIFASVISLINSDRLSKGFKPLGFLNPWLYSSASAGLEDILSGRSTGCGSTYPGANIPGAGWTAVEGWDPATGLGTPSFKKLLAISQEECGR
ncbi:related to Tripeptidyl-peptidase sed3 [Phialocephala subalpina]|uniref:Related to Tripeptidyl-peptidase sed3 n=1 Tax=Phialocephala subalpina TaxID=576137 RepID=A0A1L7WXW1_9HELO|nr:related to Tripeptidyl-peptidase sed3 [Phialocephala subalpina]